MARLSCPVGVTLWGPVASISRDRDCIEMTVAAWDFKASALRRCFFDASYFVLERSW